MSPYLSIVLPCYNSADKIQNTLATLSNLINKLDKTFEIIISDDCSNDNTERLDWAEYKTLFNTNYIRNQHNKGKGEALRRGFKICQGEFVFFMDIDLPVDLSVFCNALSILEKGESDVVIGDKKIKDSQVIGKASLGRFIASKFFNVGVQVIALPGYKDTQCPMKGFTDDAIKTICNQSFLTSSSCDVELICLSKINKYKIKKIPVIWKDDRANIPCFKLALIVVMCLFDVFRVRFVIK